MTTRDPSGLNDADVDDYRVCPLKMRTLGSLVPRVPDLRRPSSRGDDPRPVGAERRRIDGAGVPLEGEELGPGRRVPDLRRLVQTRGDDPRPVGAERRRGDARAVCPLRVRISAPVVASQTSPSGPRSR